MRELLLQEARSRGIAAEPAELAPGQWETEDEAAIRDGLTDVIELEWLDDRGNQFHCIAATF